MFRDLDPSLIAGVDASDMLRWGSSREPGKAKVRAWTPQGAGGATSPFSIVEIVTDDMPFLVDSVTAEISRSGRAIQLVAHPLLAVTRIDGNLQEVHDRDVDQIDSGMSAESWMHIHIERDFISDDLDSLVQGIERILSDVRKAVQDWPLMRARAIELAGEMRSSTPRGIDQLQIDESVALLDWLAQDSFTFIGYREYSLVSVDGQDALTPVPGTSLGILRDSGRETEHVTILPTAAKAKAREREMLVLTKANSRSTVHRPAYLDYVGVKVFNEAGDVVGERRFLGLYTARAYSDSVLEIPVLREKARATEELLELVPGSHSAKDLEEFIDTYPRDELFQITVEQLAEIAKSVLLMQERRQTKLYLRKDPYDRFVSALVYFPRDRYTTSMRLKLESILLEAFNGTRVDYTARVSESVLARIHYVVHVDPSIPTPHVDPVALEQRLADATRSWEDNYQALLIEQDASQLIPIYATAFPESYKEDFDPQTGVADTLVMANLQPDVLGLSLYAPDATDPRSLRFKVIRVGSAMPLTKILPILEKLGVDVLDEHPHEIKRVGLPSAWILEFGVVLPDGEILESDTLFDRFEDTFRAAWNGEVESDSFNALVVSAGLTWRECMIIRSYARYMRQIGSTFGQDFIESVILANSSIARLISNYFVTRFNPDFIGNRDEACTSANKQFERALVDVPSLDHDRILRTFWQLISATVRTNFYVDGALDAGSPVALAYKMETRRITEAPLPRPAFEIWVYSPEVEGVHLRFGKIARGGLRWSDRREDFRTEILGLVKAQEVKNAVIVPVGAKGGFFPKQLPDPALGRAEWMQAGISAYQKFIRTLLSVTDNIVKGEVVPPARVVRHDPDDTYLVVAADKGTATFSDIANQIAVDQGFWLADAFASGGSAGYDHKAMGITARGAWESVKRHFLEMGIDTQTQDFTVVGVGDMSGDVFGNGMLLSEHIKLLAAFDHRNIFIDPDPNPSSSFAERQRLFNLPTSSWEDYNSELISAGGGIFSRAAKSIPLTTQMRDALDINVEEDSLTPNQLINAILRSPSQLLWNGGIGTYVKASTQTNVDVGDKANDAIRINGNDLRVQVVGEGGNLGMTQLGRVEAARNGVRLNTDAIDNSAGVDTSDHEVNIKILLAPSVERGELTLPERDELLKEMTDAVGEHVLRDNFDQNIVLSNARAVAPRLITVHQRMIRELERQGTLDRAIEYLPDDEELNTRRIAGEGLTSPELAVLLAYSKIELTKILNESTLGSDSWCDQLVLDYFPTELRAKYRDQILAHPLRSEIANTVIANKLVNIGGTTFVFRAIEETGATPVEVVMAALSAIEIFGIDTSWEWINELPAEVPVSAQISLYLEIRRLLDRAVRWFLQNRGSGINIAAEIDQYGAPLKEYAPSVAGALKGHEADRFTRMLNDFTDLGAPEKLARRAADGLYVFSLLDITEIATRTNVSMPDVIDLYYTLSEQFEIDRLLIKISELPRGDRWTALARQAVRTDLYTVLAELTQKVLEATDPGTTQARLHQWESSRVEGIARTRSTLDEIFVSEDIDLATLSVALRVLRNLVAQAS